MRRCVLQDWVMELSFMQQSVLLTAIRGPDGIQKEHPAKGILRWFRRCILLSAFDGRVLKTPWEEGGGSFTGPSKGGIDRIAEAYFNQVDELPHHFQMHLMHAAQIVGYKHPDDQIACWWRGFYFRYVNALHLRVESEDSMDKRLGDSESQWRESEGVPKASVKYVVINGRVHKITDKTHLSNRDIAALARTNMNLSKVQYVDEEGFMLDYAGPIWIRDEMVIHCTDCTPVY